MTKDQLSMEFWIKDTQMFQRIAGIPETSYEELAEDWKKMHRKDKIFNANIARDSIIIFKAARGDYDV